MLSSFLSETWDSLLIPAVRWQLLVLAGCVLGGWQLSRLLQRGIRLGSLIRPSVRMGAESFYRVLSPLLILLFLALALRFMPKWQPVGLLRMALPLVASLAVIRLGFFVLRRVFVRQGTATAPLLLFEKLFALVVWSALALYVTDLWPEVLQYLESTVVPLGRNRVSLATILQALASVAVLLVLALWVGAMLEERLMQVSTVHSSVRVVLARMARAMLVLVAVLLSLSLVGIDLTVLSVFGGALGVGLGLGLQKIASSYVSGFVILLDRSLAIGDMISVDKYYGRVTQINTRCTVLQSLDGIESVIPNEMLVSGPVQNFTLSNTQLRLAAPLAVGYESDLDTLLPLLEQATAATARVLQDPAPQALLLRFGADGLELEVGFWISDPENGRMGVVSDVNQSIWRVLREQRVRVPFPQREVHLATPQAAGLQAEPAAAETPP